MAFIRASRKHPDGDAFSTLSQVLSTILSNFILKYRPNREMAPGESS